MKNLTTLEYWTKAQGELDIRLNEDNIIENWINENLKDENIKTSIEVGCYPGKFLTILGKRGVELNGVDYITAVGELKDVFIKHGYNVGEFINADFTKFKSDKKYDCVMSFGFIEHFLNWEDILQMHLNLVSENGYVVIEVPNFRGLFQKIPRFLFDYKNYKRHNIKSMDLKKWNRIIQDNGFEIVSSNYFGGYQLWFEGTTKYKILIKLRILFIKFLRKIKSKFYPNLAEHSSFSCVMGVIAKKSSNNI
jgi:2-polyprenyl-3-methyl-5-hydroxy-6-metoxy-1,4-benzoquinol methylase